MEEEVLFDDQYEVGEIIHCGAFSQSHRCVRREDQAKRVVRIIDVSRFSATPGLSVQELKREASIWTQLRHLHIVELIETYTSEGQLYMVSEYMDGGDICFEVVKRATAGFVYSEAVASYYMRQVLDAVSYLHNQGVVHRTLRPEAILMLSKENSSPVKLACLSSAVLLPSNGYLPVAVPPPCGPLALDYLHTDEQGRVGHAPYLAPEVVRGEPWSCAADCWALGCILHLLLCGQLPHAGSGDFLRSCLANSEVKLVQPQWRHISEEAQQLVLSLLAADPTRRASASDALQHSWIRDKARAPRNHLSATVEELKLVNVKRQIQMLVRNTFHSPLWLSGYQRSLWDQDWPGVDQGVQYVLNALEDVWLVQGSSWQQRPEYQRQAQILAADRFFRYWLALFDRINVSGVRSLNVAGLASPAAKSVLEDLSVPNKSYSPTAKELREILAEPNLAALLQVHDVLALEVYHGEPPTATSGLTPDQSVSASLNGHDQVESETETDPAMDKVTSVRVVQFQKNPQEAMGITLKVNESGRCVVARIMHGGMIHRQGTLHVGDEIREINSTPVDGVSVEVLQKMLASLEGHVTMKIVPAVESQSDSVEAAAVTNKQMFVRALFNYNPADDDLIPCAQAGVQFNVGDILQIISKEDGSWWQARRLSSALTEPAGLVPSPELQEWRTACQAIEQAKHEHAANCSWFGRSKKKQMRDKYVAKHNAVFDQLDLVTYEEVVQLPAFRRRTLVLLGAHGVGRRHIKNTLITSHPDRFAYPIPHTTRPPRADEENGKNYFFVRHEQMMRDIAANEYLEYGTHENFMYGTKLETVRQIHDRGLMAILDVEPQALKVLRTGDFAPYVVFIAAPALNELKNSKGASNQDASLERLARESQLLERAYGHYFDLRITNNDIEATIQRLERAIDSVCSTQQWVPVSWIY